MQDVVQTSKIFDWDQLRLGIADAVTLVVGGARGTGRTTAQSLLQLGCSVAIGDINEERLSQTVKELDAGDKLVSFIADVTKIDDVKKMIDGTVKHFGKINNIVYCAGAALAQRPTLDIDGEEWDLIMDSNLKGAFLTEQAAIPQIIKSGGGSIVNMSSRAARHSSPFLGIHYTCAKIGIIGLTRHIAKEFGPKGIRANAICPGGILGERMTFLMSQLHREHELADMAKGAPLGRNVLERDVVGVILFLLSDLSGFVTGASIDVNGGMTMT